MGKKRVWEWVLGLGAVGALEHNLDVTSGEDIKWWLWVSTLEQSYGSVVGAGIRAAEVTTDGCSRALFRFTRVDDTTCKVYLYLDKYGGLQLWFPRE